MVDARSRMIAAAERIAATEGFGAMTLRRVQAASGQRNKSAAQYHFGSRHGLIEAVLAARMGPVNERRLEHLAALPTGAPLRDLVVALVDPLARATACTPGSHWARFLFHGWADPELHDVVRRSLEAASYRQVRDRIATALDHLPEPVRRRRIDQVVGLVVLSLAASEGGTGRRRLPVEAQVADLVDACCGLLSAPTSATTAELLGVDPERTDP